MPRKSMTEYKAKAMMHDALQQTYVGWPIDTTQPLAPQLAGIDGKYDFFCVKVDQGVKGRFKKGLVRLDISLLELEAQIETLSAEGFSQFIIEPMQRYEPEMERYMSLELMRSGTMLRYAQRGGVDIESHKDAIQEIRISDIDDWEKIAEDTAVPIEFLRRIIAIFTTNHLSFMEVNPYIVIDKDVHFIDMAIEADDAGMYFVDTWNEEALVRNQADTPEEEAVLTLGQKSPASFKFSVLNKNGSVFLLLSGGGASIVVADEAYKNGVGTALANYGEYSGNPNTEETYLYTKALLATMIRSKAPQKVLFIGGAVANFTDIANTFKGIIMALKEQSMMLQAQKVKVFVRRGGPRQEVGLAFMKKELEKMGILGAVHGPEISLTKAVQEAIAEISNA
jgi:ATP-citrate lyase beta-subunit